MSIIKSKFVKIILGWFIILQIWFGVFFIVNLMPSKKTVENNAEYETKFLRLSEYKNYSSNFVASNNYLNRIDVLFKNPNLESRDKVVIYVKSNNNIIYKQSFSGFNFGDTSHARLDFETQNYSLGNEYRVEIEVSEIVDGKLFFGVKNGDIDIVEYYNFGFNIKNSYISSLDLLKQIVFGKTIVLILPALLVVFLIW